MTLNNARDWMVPIIQYLTQKELPEEIKARHIKRISARYLIVVDQLYKMGISTSMLRFISEEYIVLVMKEVHKGVCGSHIGGKALSGKNN